MKVAFGVVRGLVGITGLIQLVLGVVFWTGHLKPLIPFHMITGMVFVVALWVLAALSIRHGAPLGLVITTFAWGLLLPALGMTQMSLMPGASHWVIQVVHLLTGMVAMGLAGRLQMAVRRGGSEGEAHHGHGAPLASPR